MTISFALAVPRAIYPVERRARTIFVSRCRTLVSRHATLNLETAMDGRKRTQRAQRKDLEKKALLTEWVSA